MAHYYRFCPACKFTDDVEGSLPWGTFGVRTPCPKCGTFMGFSANAPQQAVRDTPEATITPRTHNLEKREWMWAGKQPNKLAAPDIEIKGFPFSAEQNTTFVDMMRRYFGNESALPGYGEV